MARSSQRLIRFSQFEFITRCRTLVYAFFPPSPQAVVAVPVYVCFSLSFSFFSFSLFSFGAPFLGEVSRLHVTRANLAFHAVRSLERFRNQYGDVEGREGSQSRHKGIIASTSRLIRTVNGYWLMVANDRRPAGLEAWLGLRGLPSKLQC